jgi:hypothetical protein
MVSFNDLNTKFFINDPVNKSDTINDSTYNPASLTPLFTLGFSTPPRQYLGEKRITAYWLIFLQM